MANYEFLEDLHEFLDFDETNGEKAIACLNCTGRGKPRPNISQLKLPTEAYRPSLKEKEERKKLSGRGRAHTLRNVGLHNSNARAPGSIISESGSSSSARYSSQSSFSATKSRVHVVPKNEDDLLSFMSSHQAAVPCPELLHADQEQFEDVEPSDFTLNRKSTPWPSFGQRYQKEDLNIKCVQEFPALPVEKSKADLPSSNTLGGFKNISSIIQNGKGTKNNSRKNSEEKDQNEIEDVMKGPNVLFIENIPNECNKLALIELVESFGEVEEFKLLAKGGKASAQVRMRRESSCEWVISCLNEAEGLVPGDEGEPLKCYRITD